MTFSPEEYPLKGIGLGGRPGGFGGRIERKSRYFSNIFREEIPLARAEFWVGFGEASGENFPPKESPEREKIGEVSG